MKRVVLCLSLLLSSALTGFSQNYQPQGSYDPYSSSAQPTPHYQPPAPPQGNGGGYANNSYSNSVPSSTSYSSLLSYGNLEAHYSFNSFANGVQLDSGSGVGVNMQVQLMKPLFLDFGVNWLKGTSSTGNTLKDLKMTSISAAGGAYIPIVSRFHLFGEVGLRYDVVEGATSISKDDLSVFVRPGLRFAATEKLELDANVTFNSTTNLNDRVYGLGGYYAMLDVLDLGLGADFSDTVSTYHAGLRLRW